MVLNLRILIVFLKEFYKFGYGLIMHYARMQFRHSALSCTAQHTSHISLYDSPDVRSGVRSVIHKSCTASTRATTLKFLRRKRFRKPKKIIALQGQTQAHAQVCRYEKYLFQLTHCSNLTRLRYKTNIHNKLCKLPN